MKKFLLPLLLFISTYTFAQIPTYIPTNGLVAWYPFNGNTNDESGNGNNGTNYSAALTADRKNTANSAYYFNGNARIQIPTNASLTTRVISINAWVNYSNTSTTMLITRRNWNNATAEQYSFDTKAFYVKRNGACQPAVGWQQIDYNNTPTLSTWAMMTVTYDGSNIKYYLNGVLNSSLALSSYIEMDSCTGADIIIGGCWSTYPFYFTGKMDDISIHNRPLTQAEITKIYAECMPMVSPQPTSQTSTEGQSAQFSTNSTNSSVSYQWQQNTGSGFSNLTNGGIYSGATFRNLTINNVNSDLNNSTYRCILSTPGAQSCKDTTLPVSLTVNKYIYKDIPSWLPDSNLVAWYPFNGNAFDESGNGNNGIVYGANLANDRNGFTNKSYSFNGTNSRIKVPYSSTLKTPQITINAWVRNNSSTTTMLINKRSWAAAANEQYSIDTKDFYIKRNSGCMPSIGWQNVNYSSGLDLNQWNFISLSFDGRYMKYYKNGSLINTTDLGTSQNMDTCLGAELTFGANWSNFPFWFNGNLDDISIYSRALTLAEIQKVYGQCGADLITSNPISVTSIEEGNAAFTAGANDSLAGYHWQINAGAGFQDLSNSAIVYGSDSSTLLLSNLNYDYHNVKFRCIVSTIYGCKDTSNEATLSLNKLIYKNVPNWIPDSSLVAWYPFNGNARDESGNGNNGIVSGANLNPDRFGNSNKSYLFNGSNSKIKIPYSASLKTPQITINAWVKSNSSATTMLITKRSWASAANEQYSFDTKDFYIKRNSNCMPTIGWNSVNYNAAPQQGIWILMSVSFDGRYIRYYKNGLLDNVKDLGSIQNMDTCLGAELSFGANWATFPFWFDGNLDDISIYSRALSASEILRIYGQCGNKFVVTQPVNKIIIQNNSTSISTSSYFPNSLFKWQINLGAGYVDVSNNSTFGGSSTNTLSIASAPLNLDLAKFRCIINSPYGCYDTTQECILTVNPNIKNIPYWLPDSALVAWYPFNGNAYDESGNANNGIVSGATLTQDRNGFGNKAYSFNGINNRINVPYSPSLKTPLITINAWVKKSNNNLSQIITKRNWTDASSEQYSIDTKAFYLKQNSGCDNDIGWKNVDYASSMSTNTWVMLTVSFDGRYMKQYYNGVLTSTKDLGTTQNMDTCTGAALSFGACWANFPFWYTGVLDDISIYSRALSNQEIAQIFNACANIISSEPIDMNGMVSNSIKFNTQTVFDSIATFQWQINSGSGFVNLTNNTTYSGVATKELTITGLTSAMNNNKFRCIVSTPITCNDTTRIANLGVLVNGLEDLANTNTIFIYPNPTRGSFEISSTNSKEIVFLSLTDISGKNVSESINWEKKDSLTYKVTINVNPGIYILMLSSNGLTYSKKIIIQ